MSTETLSWAWSIGLISFAFGIGVGFLVAYLLGPGTTKTRQLQKELDALKEENTAYREQVSQHFQRSAELFKGMTEQYRSVYHHLAQGAQTLCGDAVSSPALDLPSTERLERAPTSADNAETADETAEQHDTADEQPQENASVDKPRSAPVSDDESSDDALGEAPHIPDALRESTGSKPRTDQKQHGQ